MANQVPNFDGMAVSDLRAFVAEYTNITRAQAAALVGDKREGFTKIARFVRAYAENKAVAMECRLRGDIDGATVYERICDMIYMKLPEDLRW